MQKIDDVPWDKKEKYETPTFFDERLKKLWERCKEAQETLDDVVKDLEERRKNGFPKTNG